MTDLHYAAYWQDLERIKACVELGFDVNQKDDAGWTPLVWCIDMAATGGIGTAEAIIDYLAAHGAELTHSDERYENILEFARSRDGCCRAFGKRFGKEIMREPLCIARLC